jgi:hypothetical protein
MPTFGEKSMNVSKRNELKTCHTQKERKEEKRLLIK